MPTGVYERTVERREADRQRMIRFWRDPEHRIKRGLAISIALMGGKLAPEYCASISKGRLRALEADPDLRYRGAWNRGLTKESDLRVAAQARKVSETMRERVAGHPKDCSCVMHADPPNPSALSDRMIETFLSEFPVVERETRFGSFTVDAYLPLPYHLAFEADSSYWHRDRQDRDAARDAWLLRKFDLPVVRLSEDEINEAVD